MPAMRMNAEQMTPLNVKPSSGRVAVSDARKVVRIRSRPMDGWMILPPGLFPVSASACLTPSVASQITASSLMRSGPSPRANAIQNAHACNVDTIAHVGGVATGRGVKQMVGRRGEKYRHYSVAPAISTTPWLPSSPFCQPPGRAPLPWELAILWCHIL